MMHHIVDGPDRVNVLASGYDNANLTRCNGSCTFSVECLLLKADLQRRIICRPIRSIQTKQ